MFFESLEPRLLLAADFFADGNSQSITLYGDGETLRLVQTDTSELVAEFAADQLGDGLAIHANTLPMQLTIAASVHAIPGGISFDGSGVSTLIGPAENTTWRIDSPGGGDLGGIVSFQGVAEIQGSADDDHFLIGPSGSLTGQLIGGLGADTLELQAGNFSSVAFTSNGTDSGSVARDGASVAYAGIEQLIDLSVPAQQEIHVRGAATITLRNAPDARRMQIESVTGSGQITTQELSIPTESLTILAGDIDNVITIESLDPEFSADLIVDGARGTDEIILGRAADPEGNVPDASLPVLEFHTHGGDLVLRGEQISAARVAIDTRSSSNAPGDVVFAAEDMAALTRTFSVHHNRSDVRLIEVEIDGGNVTLSSSSVDVGATDSIESGYGEGVADALLGLLGQVPGFVASSLTGVAGQLVTRIADSNVVLQDTHVRSAGDVSLGSASSTDGSLHTVSVNGLAQSGFTLSVGVGVARSSAITTLEGNTSIVAAGAVDISSAADTSAYVKSRTSHNLAYSVGDAKSVAVAAADTRETSHVTIGKDVSIESTGASVNIDASGSVLNFPWSQPTIYDDGTIAVGLGLGVDDASIIARVDGDIKAKGGVTRGVFTASPDASDGARVNYVDDVIVLPAHGFRDGDTVYYSPGEVELPLGSGSAPPIQGLEDGGAYFVQRLDADSLRLTPVASLALNYSRPDWYTDSEQPVHQLQALQMLAFDESDVAVVTNQLRLTDPAPFANGQIVTYVGSPDGLVGGLVDGQSYRVRHVDGDATRIELLDPQTGDRIDLTGSGSGLQVLRSSLQDTSLGSVSFNPEVAIADNVIQLGSHELQTGDPVVYHVDPSIHTTISIEGLDADVEVSDVPVDGLEDELIYYAIRVSDTAIRLAATKVAAESYLAIDLEPPRDTSGTGLGAGHSLASSPAADGVAIRAGLEAANLVTVATQITGDRPNTASAVVQAGAVEVDSLLTPITNALASLATFFGDKATSSGWGFAGAVGVNVAAHNVQALIGRTSEINSGTDLSVTAEISQAAQVASTSTATKPKDANASAAVAAAIGVGFFTNNAVADISVPVANAANTDFTTLEADGIVTIAAHVDYGYLIANPLSSINPLDYLEGSGPEGWTFFNDGTAGFSSNLFNTFVVSSASEADHAIGGSLAVNVYDNDAVARVRAGTRIHGASADSMPTDVLVDAAIDTNMIGVLGVGGLSLNFSGFKDALTGDAVKNAATKRGKVLEGIKTVANPFGASGNKGGVGASIFVETFDNYAEAAIEAGVVIASKESVKVSAATTGSDVAIVEAGGTGASYGVAGAFTTHTLTNNAKAHIDSGASIETKSLTISAIDDQTRVGIAGGVAASQNVGVGVSIAINTIDRNTEAFLGDNLVTIGEPRLPTPSLNTHVAAKTVEVKAEAKGNIVTASLAAARTNPDGGDMSNGKSAPESLPPEQSADASATVAQAAGKSGELHPTDTSTSIAAAGDIAINAVHQGNTRAVVNIRRTDDNGAELDALSASSVLVSAINDTNYVALGGAMAISQGGDKKSAGIAGSVAVNRIEQDTRAELAHGRIRGAGVTVQAHSNGDAIAFTGAGAGATSKDGIAIAGSLSMNSIDSAAHALLHDVTIVDGGSVDVQSLHGAEGLAEEKQSTILAFGGGVAVAAGKDGPGKVGIGFGVGINDVHQDTRSLIANVNLDQLPGSSLNIVSEDNSKIHALGLSAGLGRFAGAFTVAVNTVENSADALAEGVRNGDSESLGGLNLKAYHGSLLVAEADSVAIGVDTGDDKDPAVAVGAAVAVNRDHSRAIAGVDLPDETSPARHSSHLSYASANIRATNDAQVQAHALGAAIAIDLASDKALAIGGAGAGASNEIQNTTQAGAGRQDAATGPTRLLLDDDRALVVHALDTSSIDADAEAVAFTAQLQAFEKRTVAAAVGITVAQNTVDNDTTAEVTNASVNASTASVQADSTATIKATGVSAAVTLSSVAGADTSISLTGAGVGAHNDVSNVTTAVIRQSDVGLHAESMTGGGFNTGLSVSASDGAVIHSEVYAASGSLTTSTMDGGKAISGTVAAAEADNLIANQTTAEVDDGSTVTMLNDAAVSVMASSTADIRADTVGIAASFTIQTGGDGYNLTAAGASAENTITSSTLARVDSSTLNAGKLDVKVSDESLIVAKTVAAKASIAVGGGDDSKVVNVGVAGVKATNEIHHDLVAELRGASVTTLADVDVDARGGATLAADSVAAGADLSASKGSAAVNFAAAGVGATNLVDGDIIAAIVDSHVSAGGALSLNANNDAALRSRTTAVEAALSVNLAKSDDVSIAVSVAATSSINTIENHVRAAIENSTVDAGSFVTLDAHAPSSLNATASGVAMSASIAKGNSFAFSGAGTVADSTLGNHVTAEIVGGSVISAGADVSLNADDLGAPVAPILPASGETLSDVVERLDLASTQPQIGLRRDDPLRERFQFTDDEEHPLFNSRVLVTAIEPGKHWVLRNEKSGEAFRLTVNPDPETRRIDVARTSDAHTSAVGVALSLALSVTDGASVSVAGSVGVAQANSQTSDTYYVGANIADSTVVAGRSQRLTTEELSGLIGQPVPPASQSGWVERIDDSRQFVAKQVDGLWHVVDLSSAQQADVNVNAVSNVSIDSDARAVAIAVSATISVENPAAALLSASLSAAAAVAETRAMGTTQALVSSSRLLSAGAVSLESTDASWLQSDSTAVDIALSSGAAFAIGVALADTSANSVNDAAVTGDAIVLAAGAITVNADSGTSARAGIEPVSVSISPIALSGTGGRALTTVDGAVQARVDGDNSSASIRSLHAPLHVMANSEIDARSDANGGGGSIVASAVTMDAATDIRRRTEALIADANIATSGVELTAAGNQNAETDLQLVAVGVLGAGAGPVDGQRAENDATNIARARGDVIATIGADAQLAAGQENVTVAANADARARADVREGVGSAGVSVAKAAIEATVDPEVRATVGPDSTIAANDVSVQANSLAHAESDILAVSVAFYGSGVGATSAAHVEPIVAAGVMDGARIVADSLRVVAHHNLPEEIDPREFLASAAGDAVSVALDQAVGVSNIDATSDPTVEANLAAGATVQVAEQAVFEALADTSAVAEGRALGVTIISGAAKSDATANAIGTVHTQVDGTVQGIDGGAAAGIQIRSSVRGASEALAEGVAAGVAAGGGVSSEAAASPTATTTVGSDAKLLAVGDIVVDSSSELDATATTQSVSVGLLLAVNAAAANALVAPTVHSTVNGAAVSQSGDINVLAGHNVDRLPDGDFDYQTDHGALAQVGGTFRDGALLTGGAISVSTANVVSRSAADVSALTGPASQLTATQGDVVVDAKGANLARSSVGLQTGGVFNATGDVYPDATAAGLTKAVLLGSVVDGAGGAGAKNVRVDAAAWDVAGSFLSSDSGSLLLDVANQVKPTANSTPVIAAQLGADAGTDEGAPIHTANDVTVTAHSTTDADATVRRTAGSILVNAAKLDAISTVKPSVDVLVGSHADVVAGGTIDVSAEHGDFAKVFTGAFDGASDVIGIADRIRFPDGHGFESGDQVLYEPGFDDAGAEVAPVPGLTPGGIYTVYVHSNEEVSIGPSFDDTLRASALTSESIPSQANFVVTGVDTQYDVLRFATPHNLQDGQQVTYRNFDPDPEDMAPAAPISGLTDGTSYRVSVIDDHSIKLISGNLELKSDPFLPANISDNGIRIERDLFQHGEAVTYSYTGLEGGARGVSFSSAYVDYDSKSGDRLTKDDIVGQIEPADSNVIVFVDGEGQGVLQPFTDGQAVVYHVTGGPAIKGLEDGATYFVDRQADDKSTGPYSIKLRNAAGDIVNLERDQTSLGLQAEHQLIHKADDWIGGLRSGQTYYVEHVEDLTVGQRIYLSDTRGGPRLSLDTSGRTGGYHQLAVTGLDFVDSGAGHHLFATPLAEASVHGQHRLTPLGGGRALLSGPAGDNIASAIVRSGGGAVFSFEIGGDIGVISEPQASANVASGAQLQATDISIDSHASANAISINYNRGGGLIAVGISNAATLAQPSSVTTVGGDLVALNNVDVHSTTDVFSTTNSFSRHFGLGAGARANSVAQIVQTSRVDISGGRIAAGQSIDVHADSDLTADVNSISVAGGLAAGANSNDDEGRNLPDTSAYGLISRHLTETRVAGALLAPIIDIQAQASTTDAHVLAVATTFGLFGGSRAKSNLDFDGRTNVQLDPGALIDGDQVTVAARHGSDDDAPDSTIKLRSNAAASFNGLIGGRHALAIADYTPISSVTINQGAEVTGVTTVIEATQQVDQLERVASEYFLTRPRPGDQAGDYTPRRDILFEGRINVVGQASPTLVVNSEGVVTRLTNIDATSGGESLEYGKQVAGTSIHVAPIQSDLSGGTLRIFVNDPELHEGDNAFYPGIVRGNAGVVDFRHTHEHVSIINYYDTDLIIEQIELAGLTGPSTGSFSIAADNIPDDPNLDFGTPLGDSQATLDFDIRHSFEGGTIEIQNLAPPMDDSSASRTGRKVQLMGVVDSLGGSVVITNERGNIEAADIISTSHLQLRAAGALGDENDPLRLNLVETAESQIEFSAEAGADAFLVARGLYRDPNSDKTDPIVVQADRLSADGNLRLEMLDSLQQQVATYTSLVHVSLLNPAGPHPATHAHGSGDFYSHFAPDQGPQPTSTGLPVPGDAGKLIPSFYRLDDVTVGGNLVIRQVSDLTDPTRIDVTATTDVLKLGWIEVAASGDIDIAERVGDLRAATIASTAGDVMLTAADSLVDALNLPNANVIGNSVTLAAINGGIGAADNPLELDSAIDRGDVLATATGSIVITEIAGPLWLELIESSNGDATLTTKSGSILDANTTEPYDIRANGINLDAAGNIGTENDPLEIDSAFSAPGQLDARADAGVYLVERKGGLTATRAVALGGHVHLDVLDAFTDTESFLLLPAGIVSATGDVRVRAGDDVTFDSGSQLIALGQVLLEGDFENADEGLGATITLAGVVNTPMLNAYGNADIDFFELLGTADDTINNTKLVGGAADDRFFIQSGVGTLDIQGGDGADRYYLSSVASKALFSSDGFFDLHEPEADPAAPLALLRGTLVEIKADVQITPGAGGAGESRDVVFVGAAG
ncbi:MAG: hypothetical protein KDB14_29920, partial [Planctomycetales bacterium]|nr:hypothetical protein [Planctomycetales bacterium]